jgi:hypothetical protein
MLTCAGRSGETAIELLLCCAECNRLLMTPGGVQRLSGGARRYVAAWWRRAVASSNSVSTRGGCDEEHVFGVCRRGTSYAERVMPM